MTRLEEACERYLSSRPYSLWGAFDISHEDRRKLAVKWLAEQVREVHGIMADIFREDRIGPLERLEIFGEPIGEPQQEEQSWGDFIMPLIKRAKRARVNGSAVVLTHAEFERYSSGTGYDEDDGRPLLWGVPVVVNG